MNKYKNRDWLYQKYCTEELSGPEIARICKTCFKNIYRNLNKFNIMRRTISQAKNIYYQKHPDHFTEEIKMKQRHVLQDHPRWNGGIQHSHGYRHLRNKDGIYIPEHRLIAARVLGRKLKHPERVHHINENRLDNRNSNLLICTLPYHRALHHRMKKLGIHCKAGDDLVKED